jgi:probable rRNA maturation factor
MSNINIEFNIEDNNWLEYDQNIAKNLSDFLIEISKKTKLQQLQEQNINIEISILLTNNSKIRELNKNYQKKDKATNILAFPLNDLNLQKDQNITEFLFNNNLILGDLILSLEYLKNEAKEQNKSLNHHLKHLLLHGLLHLIGYDHIAENDRKKMEELEIRILRDFEVSDPYETVSL